MRKVQQKLMASYSASTSYRACGVIALCCVGARALIATRECGRRNRNIIRAEYSTGRGDSRAKYTLLLSEDCFGGGPWKTQEFQEVFGVTGSKTDTHQQTEKLSKSGKISEEQCQLQKKVPWLLESIWAMESANRLPQAYLPASSELVMHFSEARCR